MSHSDLPHHYALLGIAPDADADAVKRAWKRAATRWHPDLNNGPQERFDAAREAWDVLGDAARRAAYDARLQASVDAAIAAMSKLEGGQRLGGVVSRVIGVRSAAPEAGRNRRMRLTVPLAQALRGTEVDVELSAQARCESCDATGCSPAGRTWVCEGCGGIGEVLAHGLLRSSWARCAPCAGLGWVPEPRCPTCQGAGTVPGVQRFVVPVPAETRDGQVLRLAGAGEPSPNGGAAGDLFVEIEVRPDAFLSPEGKDLRCERPVPFWMALAGGRVDVPTLEGSATIRIPPGTRSGDVLRMPGYGLSHAGGRGDQLVTIRVEWPATLDDAARKQIETWGTALGGEAFPDSAAFDARLFASRRGPGDKGSR